MRYFKSIARQDPEHLAPGTMGKKAAKNGSKADAGQSVKLKTYDWPASYRDAMPGPKAHIVEDMPGQIYTIPGFFSAKTCDDLIAWFSKELAAGKSAKVAFATTQLPPRKDYAARVNDRAVLVDRLATRALWKQLRSVLKAENVPYGDPNDVPGREEFDGCVGLNENLRIYRYCPGHYFGSHYDDSVAVDVEVPPGDDYAVVPGRTRWTLLIYLTGDGEVDGGATVFYPDDNNKARAESFKPRKGMALLHKHGDDCLFHEGELVKSGFKWVLRSDLVWRV